ncbi:MAG: Crp/Fnr family transcriptional regulator [Myxococcaceae bacterium]
MSTRPLEPRDIRLISQASPFRDLTDEARAEVVASARKVVLRPGQFLFREGARADSVYLVLSGRLKVLQTSNEGQSVVLRLAGPGELLALVAALGERDEYPVSAQALQTCVAARWTGQDMWKLLERYPGIGAASLRLVLQRLQELQKQYRELATERVERRIARALLRLVRQAGTRVETGVRIDMPLTRQDLAEMSGTTLYTVSRVLSAWTERGLLESKRKLITLLRPHELVAIAEDLPGP